MSRYLDHPLERWGIGLVLSLFASLALPSGASALPLYASREGKTCITCHQDPNGGGMRNDFGFQYGKNRHALDTEGRWSKVTVDPRINDWIALGVDMRLLYLAQHNEGGTTLQASTFFPMQGQLNLAVMPHDYLTVVMSRGITTDSDNFQARELYGLIHGLPHALYAQLGRFRPPFGLRQDDHTSYVRTNYFLPYNSQDDQTGIEVGSAGAKYFGQFSFTNGFGTISTQRAQTFAGKVGCAGQKLALGVSGFHQFLEGTATSVPTWNDRWGLYAMSTWQKITVIGEYGGGTDEFSGAGKQNLWGAFAELDYRLSRGVNLRGKIDYLDPNRDGAGDLYRRYLAEVDFTPVPFTELKLSYRNHDEELVGKYQEYLAQFLFPF